MTRTEQPAEQPAGPAAVDAEVAETSDEQQPQGMSKSAKKRAKQKAKKASENGSAAAADGEDGDTAAAAATSSTPAAATNGAAAAAEAAGAESGDEDDGEDGEDADAAGNWHVQCCVALSVTTACRTEQATAPKVLSKKVAAVFDHRWLKRSNLVLLYFTGTTPMQYPRPVMHHLSENAQHRNSSECTPEAAEVTSPRVASMAWKGRKGRSLLLYLVLHEGTKQQPPPPTTTTTPTPGGLSSLFLTHCLHASGAYLLTHRPRSPFHRRCDVFLGLLACMLYECMCRRGVGTRKGSRDARAVAVCCQSACASAACIHTAHHLNILPTTAQPQLNMAGPSCRLL